MLYELDLHMVDFVDIYWLKSSFVFGLSLIISNIWFWIVFGEDVYWIPFSW